MVRARLAFCGVSLIVTALVFRTELKYSVTIKKAGSILSRQPEAHMNMTNALGDRDFFCLSKTCDEQGGFQGRQTGYLYAGRIEAAQGRPMRTNQ